MVPKPIKKKRIPFSSRPMFNAAMMADPEVCRELISLAVGFEVDIEAVEDRDDEVTVEPSVWAKCSRLDVVARGKAEVFDVEMQVQSEGNLPKRTCYYHSALAVDATNKGADFEEIPNTWVIFLCKGDPLGSGLALERFAMRSDEGRELGEGRRTVFLSAKHWEQLAETASRLSQVLHYVATGRLPDDPCSLVRRIDELVDELSDDERVSRMMTYEQQIKFSETRGVKKGRAEGEENLIELIQLLKQDGRADQLDQVLTDPELRSRLMREYGIRAD